MHQNQNLKTFPKRSPALFFCLFFLFGARVLADTQTLDFMPLEPGTTWVYRDASNKLEKRVIKNIRTVEVSPSFQQQIREKHPDFKGTMTLSFIEMHVWEGSESDLATIVKTGQPPKQTYFFLRTDRGILRSVSLGNEKGKEADDFWPQAFFLLPNPLKEAHVWQAYAFENRIDLEFHGKRKVVVPLGSYDNCLNVSYRFGLEKDAWGEVDFCAGVGEVRVKEGEYVRDLISFTPGKKTDINPQIASAGLTDIFWSYLPQDKKIEVDSEAMASGKTGGRNFLRTKMVGALVGLLLTLSFAGVFFLKFGRRGNRPRSKNAIDGEKFQSFLNEASVLIDAKKLPEAEVKLLHLLVHHTKDSTLQSKAFFLLGVVCEGLGKMTEAIENYEEVLDLDDQHAPTRLKLAHLFASQGRLAESYEHLRLYLKFRPEDADIHNRCGQVLRDLGNAEKARLHFEKALALNPHFHEARENIKALGGVTSA